jgi:hypothetical protein
MSKSETHENNQVTASPAKFESPLAEHFATQSAIDRHPNLSSSLCSHFPQRRKYRHGHC